MTDREVMLRGIGEQGLPEGADMDFAAHPEQVI